VQSLDLSDGLPLLARQVLLQSLGRDKAAVPDVERREFPRSDLSAYSFVRPILRRAAASSIEYASGSIGTSCFFREVTDSPLSYGEPVKFVSYRRSSP
jgi:hypothetical protein